jgi:hypothetical protein
MWATSYSGVPSTIHSAITLPTPPAAARPCTQKPAATQQPATAVSPRMNSPSGVNASGPCTTFAMAASRSAGTRRRAARHDSPKPSRSGSNSDRGSANGAVPSDGQHTCGERM